MGDRCVVLQGRVATGETVEVRRGLAAQDASDFLVLEHDNHNVTECGNCRCSRGTRRCGNRDETRRDGEPGSGSQARLNSKCHPIEGSSFARAVVRYLGIPSR